MPWWKSPEGLFLSHSGAIWSYGKITAKDPAPHAHGSYALDNNGYGPQMLKYPAADTQFHTYGLYWGPGKLTFYIDSKPIYYVNDDKHVPDVPEYILLNCALSQNGWGMGPKKDPTLKQIEDGMPSTMQIDYVRVYTGTPEP
jgi:beta-glucanase (GH16 family)